MENVSMENQRSDSYRYFARLVRYSLRLSFVHSFFATPILASRRSFKTAGRTHSRQN